MWKQFPLVSIFIVIIHNKCILLSFHLYFHEAFHLHFHEAFLLYFHEKYVN